MIDWTNVKYCGKLVGIVLAVGFGLFLVLAFTPGPGVTVINNTDRTITLYGCGDIISQLPPGALETLTPGGRISIGSNVLQPTNVCEVQALNNIQPIQCLELPRAGETTIQPYLKPYLTDGTGCDSYSFRQ
jgi:hypothetical protein